MRSESADEQVQSANTLRERIGVSRPYSWFLFGGNRLAVTALLSGSIFAVFVVVSAVAFPPPQVLFRGADTIETVFSTALSTIITGTTLVVTISQLVISQENGPLGDQHKRMRETMDFRQYARASFESTPAAAPGRFLRQLILATERRAEALDAQLDDTEDEALAQEVDELVASLRGNTAVAVRGLEQAQFGTFGVLDAALNYNYDWKIYQLERIADEFSDSLDADDLEAFHELKTVLSLFGPAREHFKTLYFEWELIDLSRYILYAAIPAIVVSGLMAFFVGADSFPGAILGVPTLTWVVAGAFTSTLVPFLLFLAYILRIVFVAKHTLAIGPFVLRSTYSPTRNE
jgi:hypothetical protein